MPDFSVAVFFRGSSIHDAPFDKEEYRQAYFELDQEIRALHGKMIITRDQDTYLGDGRFSQAWSIIGPNQYELLSEQQVDVVFDKGGFESDGNIPQFNHPDINRICADKHLTYSLFSEFCPETFFVQDEHECQSALSKIQTEKAVIKPQFGFEGNDILIEDRELLKQQTHQVSFPALVQEFMDTSRGIPGIVDGFHDLRIVVFNGEMLFSYVRTPPPGKLTANVAQGGSLRVIPSRQLPATVWPIIEHIDQQLSHVGERFYSIDLAFTPEGPKLIEMNSRVGVLPNREDQVFLLLKQKLAETFQSLSQ